MIDKNYCHSRYQTHRHKTHIVNVGNINIGGNSRIKIQSMSNVSVNNIEGILKQLIELSNAGCDIIRIAIHNNSAIKSLKEVNNKFKLLGFSNPIVADVHFSPKLAFEALNYAEKVRINPGNFIDQKKFIQKTYSDIEYKDAINKIYDSFAPLIIRAQELGRALRIGANHGSLSDRIVNKYGNTALGMVESVLEFLRIAVDCNFKNIVISLKSSDPRFMIYCNRLMVHYMNKENMTFPIHIGVTEAGNEEDGRIKSFIGIGGLLIDGIGDTIRVSLTENPIHELPVNKQLVQFIEKLKIN